MMIYVWLLGVCVCVRVRLAGLPPRPLQRLDKLARGLPFKLRFAYMGVQR
jgi:hypothetical protein